MRDAELGQENFTAMRKAMVVSQLRTTDVSDPRLIAAMGGVAREDFVPPANRLSAYVDRGVSIGEGRALNAPLATGQMLNVAQLTADDNVLLIGAATGYTAAVIARIVATVTAVEQNTTLAMQAGANLKAIDNITVKAGNHAAGAPENAPYTVIVIDGVVEQITDELTAQLADDGRLVAAVLDDGISRLILGRKVNGVVGYQYFADCGGCSLPGFEKAAKFNF